MTTGLDERTNNASQYEKASVFSVQVHVDIIFGVALEVTKVFRDAETVESGFSASQMVDKIILI